MHMLETGLPTDVVQVINPLGTIGGRGTSPHACDMKPIQLACDGLSIRGTVAAD